MSLIVDYRAHDAAYRAKIGKGDLGWDTDAREYAYFSDTIRRTAGSARASVLEIGCGMGNILASLRDAFPIRAGIDVSQAAIEHARKHDPGADYRCGDFLDAALDRPFDVVVESKVLHCIHPDHRVAFLQRMRDLLQPDGVIVGCHMFGITTAKPGYDPRTCLLAVHGHFTRYIPHDIATLQQEFARCGMAMRILDERSDGSISDVVYAAARHA